MKVIKNDLKGGCNLFRESVQIVKQHKVPFSIFSNTIFGMGALCHVTFPKLHIIFVLS